MSFLTNMGFYPADHDKMIEKAEKAISMLSEVERLLTESTSGGLHDTGCHADHMEDKCILANDDAVSTVNKARVEAKRYLRHLKKFVPIV